MFCALFVTNPFVIVICIHIFMYVVFFIALKFVMHSLVRILSLFGFAFVLVFVLIIFIIITLIIRLLFRVNIVLIALRNWHVTLPTSIQVLWLTS